MIIEIGTSDFNTLAGKEEGIFIEPVKYYFDRLDSNCIKENVAISNYEGEIKIYYLTEDDIIKYKLPNWIRGCNSINKPHPQTRRFLNKSQIRMDIVKVVKIKSIIDKYKVEKIDFLKIDTEGHDCVILNNFLDEVNILPDKIQIENNRLTNKEEISKICERLNLLGYKIERINKEDLIAKKIK